MLLWKQGKKQTAAQPPIEGAASTAPMQATALDSDPARNIEIVANDAANVYVRITNNFGADCPKKPRAVRFAVIGIEVKPKPQERSNKMLEVKLRTTQQALVRLSPVDRFNKVEPLDGDPQVRVVSGDASVTLNGLDLTIEPSDTPGTTVIEVTGDAQEGEGKEVITETITVIAQHENAISLGASLVSITDKPAPPAPTT